MHSNLAPSNISCLPSSPIAGDGSHIIITSGDRFINAHEINDLFEQESPVGQLYLRLKELGITVEREWWIDSVHICEFSDVHFVACCGVVTRKMSNVNTA